MTVTITSDLPVALVNGTGVRLDARTVPAITTDDIYDPVNPTRTITELLNRVSCVEMVGSALIDCTAVGDTPIYTVPAKHSFIPTQIIFMLTDVGLRVYGDGPYGVGVYESGVAPAVNVGFTGLFRELIDSGKNPSLFDQIYSRGQVLSVINFTSTGSKFQYIGAGNVLTVYVAVASTFSTYILKCLIFGLLTGNLPQVIPLREFGKFAYGEGPFGRF